MNKAELLVVSSLFRACLLIQVYLSSTLEGICAHCSEFVLEVNYQFYTESTTHCEISDKEAVTVVLR